MRSCTTLLIGMLLISPSGCADQAASPGTPQTEPDEMLFHTGCCDASAGVALTENLFVVANDEDNVLRVYRADQSGGPVQSFELSRMLRVERKEPESDIEGAARMGDKIFWITSHGRSKKGKERASRHRFFATSITVSGDSISLEMAGTPYDGLLADMVKEPKLRQFKLASASERAPKSEGAFNIEGLSSGEGNQMFIGFRNPIPQGRALIVPFLNPEQVIQGARAQFGDPILLDLGGLGVRGLARVDDQYFILAGGYNGGEESRLYQWDGTNSSPKIVKQFDFKKANPEGILVFPGTSGELRLLNDDGTVKIGGKDCKDLADPSQKRFRSFVVKF